MNEIEITRLKHPYINLQFDAIFDEIHGCIHIPVVDTNILFVYCIEYGKFQLKREFMLKQILTKIIDFDDKQETLIYLDDQLNIQAHKMMKYSSSISEIQTLHYAILLSLNDNNQYLNSVFQFDKKRSILIIGLQNQLFIVDTIKSKLVYRIILQNRLSKIKYEKSTNLIKCFEEYYYEQINLDSVYQQKIIYPFPSNVKSYSLLIGFIYFQMDIQQQLLIAYDERRIPLVKSFIDFSKISNFSFIQNIQYSILNSQQDSINLLVIMNNFIAKVKFNEKSSQLYLISQYIDPDNDVFQSDWVIINDKNPSQLIIFCHNSFKVKIFDANQNSSRLLVTADSFLMKFYLSNPSQYFIAVDKNNKCIIADIFSSQKLIFSLDQLSNISQLSMPIFSMFIIDAQILEKTNQIIIQCYQSFLMLNLEHIFEDDSNQFLTQEIQVFETRDPIEQLFIDSKQNLILIYTTNDVIIQQFSIDNREMIYSNLHKPSYASAGILECQNYLFIYSKSSINIYLKLQDQTYQMVISNYNEFPKETIIKEIIMIQEDSIYQNNFFIVILTNQIKILALDPKNIMAPLITIQTLLLKNFQVTYMETFNFDDIQYFSFDMIKYGERISINMSYDFFNLQYMVQQVSEGEQTCVFEFKEALISSYTAYWSNQIEQINKQSLKSIEDLVLRVNPNTILNIPELNQKYVSQYGLYVSFTQGTRFKANDTVFLPLQVNYDPISTLQIYNLNISFLSNMRFILDGLKNSYLSTVFLEKINLSQQELVDNSFVFANLNFVSIKDLVIKDTELINNSMQVPLFLFQNVSKVILASVRVSNISLIDYTTLFSFQNISQVKIINFTINNCFISTPVNEQFEQLNNYSQTKNDYFFIKNTQNITKTNSANYPTYKFISFFQFRQDLSFNSDKFQVVDYATQIINSSKNKRNFHEKGVTYNLEIVDEGIASYIFSFYNTQNISISNFTIQQNNFQNLARILLVQNCQDLFFSQVQLSSIEFVFEIDQEAKNKFVQSQNQFDELVNYPIDENEKMYEDYEADSFELYNLQPFIVRSLICFHKIDRVLVDDFSIQNAQIYQNFLIFLSVLQTKYFQLNNTNFNKIFQTPQRLSVLIKAQNIYNFKITNSFFQNNYNVIYLDQQELKISRTTSLKNNIVNIDKITLKSSFNQKSFLSIDSFFICITNSIFFNLNNQQNGIQFIDYSLSIQFNDYAALPFGILNLFNYNNFQADKLTFFQCKSRNIAGICLSNGNISVIKNSKFEANTATINAGGLLFFQIKIIQMMNCIFLQNKSLQGTGGAILIIQSTIDFITNCEFVKNSANSDSGGAIYISTSDLLQSISNNTFIKNQAAIGAAVRITNQYSTFKIPLLIQNNIFLNNTSILYGSTVTSYPQKMIFVDQKLQTKDILSFQHTSGYNLEEPFYIALLDEDNQIINHPTQVIKNQNNLQFSKSIEQEFKNYQVFFNIQTNKNKFKIIGKSTYYFEDDKPIFLLNITLIGIIQNSQNISIETINKYPQVMQNISQIPYSPLKISFQVNFKNCQRGEVPVYQDESNFTICSPCPSGKYSLEKISFQDIYNKKIFTCNLCPESAEFCEKDIIKLKNSYWKNNDSDKIYECNYNTNNCQAELYQDPNQICAEGYVGVFCKECDYAGSIWGQKFGRFNTGSCRSCKESYEVLNQIILAILVMILMFYITYQLSIQRKYAKKSCIAYYLRKSKIIPMGISEFTNLNAVYTKLLINHLQILALFRQLNIPIPKFFSQSADFFGGDPNSLVSANIDCLSSEFSNLPTYVNISLLSILNPLVLFGLITVFRIFFIFIRFLKGKIQFLQPKSKIVKKVRSLKIKMITCLIFLYFFYAPSILNRILSYMVCAQIDDLSYIVGMSNLRCFDKEHKVYLFSFLLPLCLLWALIIPAYFFLKLKSNREYLDQIRMKFQFGFIYQEYKRSCYYWEFVKIFLKFTIISTLMIFYEQQTIRIIIVATLALVYNQLIYFVQPFVSKILNQAEKYSTITLIFTGFLILPINDETNTNEIYIIIIKFFILLTNISFLFYMLKLIFLQPLPYSYHKMNFFQKFIYKLKFYFPNLFSSVKYKPSDPYRVFRNWKKLKVWINKFVSFKDQQKLKDSHIIEAATQNHIKSLAFLEQSDFTSKEYDKNNLQNTVQIFSYKNLESPTLLNKQQEKSKLLHQIQLSNIVTNTSSRKSDTQSYSNQLVKLSYNSNNQSNGSSDSNQKSNDQKRLKQSPRKTGILINKSQQQSIINPKQMRKISFPQQLVSDQIIPRHKLSSFSKIKETQIEGNELEQYQQNKSQN